jgi:hypothetical protein
MCDDDENALLSIFGPFQYRVPTPQARLFLRENTAGPFVFWMMMLKQIIGRRSQCSLVVGAIVVLLMVTHVLVLFPSIKYINNHHHGGSGAINNMSNGVQKNGTRHDDAAAPLLRSGQLPTANETAITTSHPHDLDSNKSTWSRKQTLGTPATTSVLIEENNTINDKGGLNPPRQQRTSQRIVPPSWDTSSLLIELLEDPWTTVNQTLCAEQSQFCNPHPHFLSDHDWHIRLLYLGIYLHQHLPAKPVLLQAKRLLQQQRRRDHASDFNNTATINTTVTTRSNSNNITTISCHPDTKYLVASLPVSGTGSTFRNAAVPALLAGLATDRVVLFVNDRPYGTEQMQAPWILASKEECPSGDYTCFFLPISPCTLTDDEIQNGTILYEDVNHVEVLLNPPISNGTTITPVYDYENERVLVLNAEAAPLEPNDATERRIRQRIHDLVRPVAQKYHAPCHVWNQTLLLPYQLYDRTRQQQQYNNNNSNTHGVYGLNMHHATSTLHHAALLYLLRPNAQIRQRIEHDVRLAIPNKDFDPEWSFGVPIRGELYWTASERC